MPRLTALLLVLMFATLLQAGLVYGDKKEDWVARGDEAYKASNFAQAVKCYSKALQVNPRDHTALLKRGRAYYKLEKFDEALLDFDAVQYYKELREQALYGMGVVCLALKEYGAAESYFRKSYAINGNVACYVNAASAALNGRDFSKAMEYSQAVLRKDPKNKEAKAIYARAVSGAREQEKAEQWLPAPEMFQSMREWKRIEKLRDEILTSQGMIYSGDQKCEESFTYDAQLWHQGYNFKRYEELGMSIPCRDLLKLCFMAAYTLQGIYRKQDPASRCSIRGQLSVIASAFGGLSRKCEYDNFELAKEAYDEFLWICGHDTSMQSEPRSRFENFARLFRLLYQKTWHPG